LYAYCSNNPINLIDPWGLQAGMGAVGGAIAGATVAATKCPKGNQTPTNPDAPQVDPSCWELDFDKANEIADEMLNKYPGHNDLGDAMRHAEWSKRMSEEINPATSYLAGLGHEIDNLRKGGSWNETRMDLHNNREGRRAAKEGREINPDNLVTSPNQNRRIY
jgi:hypothetical protein